MDKKIKLKPKQPRFSDINFEFTICELIEREEDMFGLFTWGSEKDVILNDEIEIPNKFTGTAIVLQENRIAIIAEYRDGVRNGKFHYWPVKNRKWRNVTIAEFKDGKLNGLMLQWPRYGKYQESQYKEHKPHGENNLWNHEGKLIFQGNYVNGAKEGLHQRWNENDDLIMKGEFKNNRSVGYVQEWHDNGNLKSEYEIVEGFRIHGLAKKWNEEGQLIEESHYKKGIKLDKLG